MFGFVSILLDDFFFQEMMTLNPTDKRVIASCMCLAHSNWTSHQGVSVQAVHFEITS